MTPDVLIGQLSEAGAYYPKITVGDEIITPRQVSIKEGGKTFPKLTVWEREINRIRLIAVNEKLPQGEYRQPIVRHYWWVLPSLGGEKGQGLSLSVRLSGTDYLEHGLVAKVEGVSKVAGFREIYLYMPTYGLPEVDPKFSQAGQGTTIHCLDKYKGILLFPFNNCLVVAAGDSCWGDQFGHIERFINKKLIAGGKI